MGEKATIARPLDDLSVEEILALMYENGKTEVGTPVLEVSSLGPKGENRFYVQKKSEDQVFLRIRKSDEPLSEGAKEITWEQACEVLIRLKVNREYYEKMRELLEQKQELVRQWEQFVGQREQFVQQAQHLGDQRSDQARAEARARRRGLLWGVLGYQSVQASRAFGRWIKNGP
jgi:hypothetical protein